MICWCKTYPGCRNSVTTGHLCDICRKAGHRAYTEREIERAKQRRKEARNGQR